MDLKKEAFIEAYKKTFGNITESCKACDIKGRITYYRWLEGDAEFKEAIDNIEPDECFIDFAEDALIKKIKDGDTTAIIYALKSKGKKRGWGESSAIEHSYKNGFDIIYEDANSSG
jgi:hypothetical protein